MSNQVPQPRHNQDPHQFVYHAMFDLFASTVETHVNASMMDVVTPDAYDRFTLAQEFGVSEAEFKVLTAVALRDAWKLKVAADNVTPIDVLKD